MAKTKLDKDLKRLSRMEYGAQDFARSLVPFGLALLFLVAAAIFAAFQVGVSGVWAIAVGATVVGAYMALNIGANDVANNMSPAVGSRALTIGVAVMIAAVCEAAGAIIAGGDVVETVSKGIIDPSRMPGTEHFVIAMIAALFAAALWINLATWLNAPVSTTHSVVGGVLGGGVAMAGLGVADWSVVASIVASWVVSPVMGGAIAAGFLAYLKRSVYDAPDRLSAAALRVPLLVAIMVGAFSAYLMMKGLNQVLPVSFWMALAVGLLLAVPTYFLVRPRVQAKLARTGDGTYSLGDLFTIPVIGGAALLSFAHGANDVANAIGPLSAIHAALRGGVAGGEVVLPFWILLVGAGGIAVGLALFGPKLIRTVGSKITKLNRVRAFCVTLSAAITVIIASALGLPVSSTHTAIGALFGVGFLREYFANQEREPSKRARIFRMDPPPDAMPIEDRGAVEMAKLRAKAEKQRKRYLVRRSHVFTIAAAWIITVPCSALLAAVLARLLLWVGLGDLI
ncbi:inorganic phosphate transporter [Aquibaculum arenosum]|nr:inorganic phosphate transporter [Fodinicurvata sp. CAU 1616]